ncbi:phosphatidylglycerophosphatase A family protein [Desulfovibrio oxyclinae]|uniref:phosphatidylglycerophosphatase A family protein n=1 Tax=Desulfovibrio oxyclinae TaxID=63560 RepID=UPI0003633C95|nr:phosphatidylglycerophosphatase A [Desulfovibrio oxyclinae]
MQNEQIKNRLALFISTVGYSGYLKPAPGTWGSLAAMLLAPALFMPLNIPGRLAILLIILGIGTWAATRTERITATKDPGSIVIDELLGLWATYCLFPELSPLLYLLGFGFFRLFDILKPWPVKNLETAFEGGLGVMIDDVAAGIYAAFCLGLFNYILL